MKNLKIIVFLFLVLGINYSFAQKKETYKVHIVKDGKTIIDTSIVSENGNEFSRFMILQGSENLIKNLKINKFDEGDSLNEEIVIINPNDSNENVWIDKNGDSIKVITARIHSKKEGDKTLNKVIVMKSDGSQQNHVWITENGDSSKFFIETNKDEENSGRKSIVKVVEKNNFKGKNREQVDMDENEMKFILVNDNTKLIITSISKQKFEELHSSIQKLSNEKLILKDLNFQFKKDFTMFFKVKSKKGTYISVYDKDGNLLKKSDKIKGTKISYDIDIKKNGLYYVVIDNNAKSKLYKMYIR